MLANPKTNHGAFSDCIRDYGINTNMMVCSLLTFSYAHLIRFVLYEVTFVYH